MSPVPDSRFAVTLCTTSGSAIPKATYPSIAAELPKYRRRARRVMIMEDRCFTCSTRAHRRRPRVGVSPMTALAVGTLTLALLARGGADAFVASPQLLSVAAEAFGPRGGGMKRSSPRVFVGMVSGAVGATSASKVGEAGGGSLGERLRADFPILDQVCRR